MCTRVFWNKFKHYTMVGRSMDWPESTEPILTVFPRGMQRDCGCVGSPAAADNQLCTWTSQHGSLVTTLYGVGTADGLNERGVAVHMLYLDATSFGPRVAGKPVLPAALWGQYVLDNAGSVSEALELLEGVQVVMTEAHGHKSNVHLAIEDAAGDSAIIEYIHGKQVVHHGPDFRIVTNDPTYDEQLALLATQDFSKPSSDLPLPGNVSAVDRFQRAAYFYSILPEPKSEREAIASLIAIVRNASVPFGAPYKDFGVYTTEYRTVCDLTTRRYFFELTTSPHALWIDLPKFKLTPGSPVMVLNPNDPDLVGNVTERFRRAEVAPF